VLQPASFGWAAPTTCGRLLGAYLFSRKWRRRCVLSAQRRAWDFRWRCCRLALDPVRAYFVAGAIFSGVALVINL